MFIGSWRSCMGEFVSKTILFLKHFNERQLDGQVFPTVGENFVNSSALVIGFSLKLIMAVVEENWVRRIVWSTPHCSLRSCFISCTKLSYSSFVPLKPASKDGATQYGNKKPLQYFCDLFCKISFFVLD